MKSYLKFWSKALLWTTLILISYGCWDDDDGCSNNRSISYNNSSISIERNDVRLAEKRDEYYARDDEDRPFDLFYPEEKFDPQNQKLLIVVHEGAFVVGDKDQYFVQKLCKSLARKGHVTAAVNYSKILDRAQYPRTTIVDAILDVDGVTKHIQSNYGFLPKNTYIVGYSAGAIIANHMAMSQVNELKNYADVSDIPDSFGSKKFAGIVSISGGLMDYNHVDDQDLDDIRMLMIHGTSDKMVPYTRGRAMDRTVDKDIKIKPPVYWDIEISLIGPVSPSLVISSQALKALRNLLVPDELCGPNCIMNELCGHPNFSVLTVKKGPHNLFYNDERQVLNKTYPKIISKIDAFVSERSSSSNGSRDERRSRRERRSRNDRER